MVCISEKLKYIVLILIENSIFRLCKQGEGALAYAQWVCRLLSYYKKDSIRTSTTPKADMSHLPLDVRRIVSKASVSLQKSTGIFFIKLHFYTL